VENNIGREMDAGNKGSVREECVGDGVFVYTLERGGIRAVFSNWGATLMSLFVPDAAGESGDIVLGFDTLGPYMASSFLLSRNKNQCNAMQYP
jgi:hypothetical protein